MSIAAVKWAFRQEGLTPAAKLILVRLAESADADGVCFPSREVIARECGVDLSSVSRAVKQFEEAGILSIEKVRRRNRYTLYIGCDIPPIEKPGKVAPCNVASRNVAPCNVIGCDSPPSQVATVHMTYKEEPSIEPSRNHQLNNQPGFDEFWRAYPHPRNRGSKKKARERWKRVKDPPAVMRGVAHYAAYCASEAHWYSPKMAEGWLNGQNWENWQEPPKHEYTRTLNADRFEAIVSGRDTENGGETGNDIWPAHERRGGSGSW